MPIGLRQNGVSWRRQTRNLVDDLVDALLPPVCGNCKRVGNLFCLECRAAVVWLEEPVCRRCGRPQQRRSDLCPACDRETLPVNHIRAAALYTEPVRTVIHKMKYEGFFALARPLADLMVDAWPRWQHDVDLVLPIPLHVRRQRERGYNQSELLVRAATDRLGWVDDCQALKRSRQTRPQIGLNPIDRAANVRNAFTADAARVAGRRILLVDDVCTTGSTLASAATALLAAGAESVTAYCLALAAGN